MIRGSDMTLADTPLHVTGLERILSPRPISKSQYPSAAPSKRISEAPW